MPCENLPAGVGGVYKKEFIGRVDESFNHKSKAVQRILTADRLVNEGELASYRRRSRQPAKPIKPDPSNRSEPGSGVETGPLAVPMAALLTSDGLFVSSEVQNLIPADPEVLTMEKP